MDRTYRRGAQATLIALAIANALYLIWCAIADQAVPWPARLLTPAILLAAVLFQWSRMRDST